MTEKYTRTENQYQFVLFMQITTFSTNKTKPNLQVMVKKTVCLTSKLQLLSIFFFGKINSTIAITKYQAANPEIRI